MSAIKVPMIRKSLSRKKQTAGKVTAPRREPTDILLLARSPITTIPSAERASKGLIARSAPKAVATPFPPLKWYRHGHICPQNTASAQTAPVL